MRLARIKRDGASTVIGITRRDGRDVGVDLRTAGDASTMSAVMGRVSAAGLCTPREDDLFELSAGDLLRPIDDDARILCAGFNFSDHAGELKRDLPSHPTLFPRFASSLAGPADAIVVPSVSTSLDWEGELAVVIGRGGRAIREDQAWKHVGGYVCFGDHSVREYQLHSTQATAGKNFDQSGAIGPWIVTSDEIPEPAALQVFTYLNRERVQHGALSKLVFGIPELIAYVSTFMALRPGDVIATGTPSGVGASRTPARWLRPGEEVIVEVPGVGRLANLVVAADGRE